MILAKSRPEISLEDHLFYVAFYIEKFAHHYDFNIELSMKGAILHDIGKAHHEFQHRIRNPKIYERTFRHELSSLAFLSLFENKNELIEMVVAHHKSIEDDWGGRGILDLDQNDEYWIDYHLGEWDKWKDDALKIMSNLGIDIRDISIDEARENLEYCVEYCDHIEDGWSRWRGLLMSADHMASALHDRFDNFEHNLFTIPPLDFYNERSKNSDAVQFPLSKKRVDVNKKHTLVIAPTGSGKTDFLMRRTQKRIFYCLPFQASINAMTNRFRNDLSLNDHQVRMQHSSSKISDKDSSPIGVDLQNFGGASIKVLTPYQIAGILFCHHGYESMILDLMDQDIIMDEVHVYGDNAQAIVLSMVKLLIQLNCRIHIGSATIPTALYSELLNCMGGEDEVYEVSLSENEMEFYNRHIINPVYDENEAIFDAVRYCSEDGEKILLISNTVAKAQRWYFEITQSFPNIKIMLIHSKYKRGDRARLERNLMEEFDGKDEPCILISTQVVEVSIDISFDRMFTETAPIDSLIQRFGRVNRRVKAGVERGLKNIHIIKPSGKTLPYSSDIVRNTFNLLENVGPLQERDTQMLVDHIYPDVDLSNIDSQILWKNGKLIMKKLCNTRQSPLIQLLEIDTITCILPEDITMYEEGNFKSRNELEISMHFNSLFSIGRMEQLEVGNNPFILPEQPFYEPYGVIANIQKIFIN